MKRVVLFLILFFETVLSGFFPGVILLLFSDLVYTLSVSAVMCRCFRQMFCRGCFLIFLAGCDYFAQCFFLLGVIANLKFMCQIAVLIARL